MRLQKVKIVLVGMPNVGKTTFFNQITGAHFKVGNWSGVTVKENSMCFSRGEVTYEVVDLPGILSVYDDLDQVDYAVCRDTMAGADVFLNIVDGRHVQRDLVLSLQLLCYQIPQVTIVTHDEHMATDHQRLASAFSTPLGLASSLTLDQVLSLCNQAKAINPESLIEWPVGLQVAFEAMPDSGVLDKLKILVKQENEQVQESYDVLIAEGFYHTAALLIDRHGCRQVCQDPFKYLDDYVLHPIWGVPIFLVVMYVMFSCTIGLGGALGEFISGIMQLGIASFPGNGFMSALISAVGSGVATGVGFVTILVVMYVILGFLEQSGYLARVVILVDGLMRPIGLSGHAFIPMILGFGCNVPAVLATRTISGDWQRLLTGIMLPFMSCSARLSIFAIFAAAFFPGYGALVIMLLYLFGVFVAIASAYVLNAFFGDGSQSCLSISLPKYQYPNWPQLKKSVCLKVKGFMKRTMGYIVFFSTLVAILGMVDFSLQVVEPQFSVMTTTGKALSHGFAFMGLGPENWQAVAALLSGLVAKEIVITTLNTLYQGAEALSPAGFDVLCYELFNRLLHFPLQVFLLDSMGSDVQQIYQSYFSVQSALAYMVFILLYFPCVSTLLVFKQEFGTAWSLFVFGWSTLLAVGCAMIVYGGFLWILGVGVVILWCVLRLRRRYDSIVC